jgi:hypothetical protein
MRHCLTFVILSIAVGCSDEESTTRVDIDTGMGVKPPQIAAKLEEGFVDLSFALESRKHDSAVGERLVAIGQDGERAVAFAILIESGWKDVKFEGIDLPTYQGRIVIESVGPPSDELVRAIDRLYVTNAGATKMQRETRFTGISLGGNPSDLDAGPTKIKLFFESEAEDRYAEVFLNIDVRARSIELNEKDPDYRRPVVSALSGM